MLIGDRVVLRGSKFGECRKVREISFRGSFLGPFRRT